MFAAVRVAFNTVRYAEVLNQRLCQAGQQPLSIGHFSVLDIGGQSTLSGSGEIYDEFLANGTLSKFSGYSERPVGFFETNFKTASLRKLRFDETYYGMQYDCRSSKHILK